MNSIISYLLTKNRKDRKMPTVQEGVSKKLVFILILSMLMLFISNISFAETELDMAAQSIADNVTREERDVIKEHINEKAEAIANEIVSDAKIDQLELAFEKCPISMSEAAHTVCVENLNKGNRD